MVERIARRLGTARGDVVLDVGCGVGGPARRLAELVGCRVVGLDVVREVLRSAARRPGPRVSYVAGSAAAVPFRSGSIDQAWALGVVAHVVDPEQMAAELRRVLRPGGAVAVTEVFWEGRGRPRFADIRSLPWPGAGIPGAYDPGDVELRRDLRDGRLVPALVVAERP